VVRSAKPRHLQLGELLLHRVQLHANLLARLLLFLFQVRGVGVCVVEDLAKEEFGKRWGGGVWTSASCVRARVVVRTGVVVRRRAWEVTRVSSNTQGKGKREGEGNKRGETEMGFFLWGRKGKPGGAICQKWAHFWSGIHAVGWMCVKGSNTKGCDAR
jgi:hypothetical protein